MTTRTIRDDADMALLLRYLNTRNKPFRVEITDGRSRSIQQNKLQRLWLGEASEQLGFTPEELRGWCKLHLGVPILRLENDQFRGAYDRIIRPLPYEQKLQAMMVPLDMPITRIMTTVQKTTYLDQMSQHFLEQGVALTDPRPMEAA